jgi:dienelactone hydrolase
MNGQPAAATGTGAGGGGALKPTTGNGGGSAPATGAGGGGTALTNGGAGQGMANGGAAGSTAGSAGMSGSAGMTGTAGSGNVMTTGKIPAHGPDPADTISGMDKGPYQVMMYTTGYPQSPDYADSTIYAPTDAEPPLASVAVVPGFVSPQSSIQNWGPFLASFGIATITIGTLSPTDPPATREVALMGALKTMQDENTRMGSPLMGKLATDVQATMGWSMGGGGTLLAANDHHELKATVSMCAWNPGFSYSMITSPALMFASQGDPLAGGQSQGFYMSVPDMTPKMLIETPGGDHFVANDPVNQSGMIGRYGLSWLKVFLEGDERYRKILLMMPGVMTTDFQTNLK